VLRAFAVLFVLGCVALSGYAQTPPGFGAGLFAHGGIDARAAAMGEAFAAVAAGGAATYYNPAGLAGVSGLELGGMYSEPYGEAAGVTFQYVSIVGPLGVQTDSAVHGLGVGLAWGGTTISDIPIWEDWNQGGVFSAVGSTYSASAAIPVPGVSDWAIGVTVKYYFASILEGRGEGFGFDLGVLGSFSIADVPIHIGWNSVDVAGTTVHWHGTAGEPENFMPWVNRFGAAAEFLDSKVLIACDFDWAVGRPEREQNLHAGVELDIIDVFALRAGWQTDLEWNGNATVGIGVHLLGKLAIDYAYLPAKVMGATHILSIQLSL